MCLKELSYCGLISYMLVVYVTLLARTGSSQINDLTIVLTAKVCTLFINIYIILAMKYISELKKHKNHEQQNRDKKKSKSLSLRRYVIPVGTCHFAYLPTTELLIC
jgi:hypothetical protein